MSAAPRLVVLDNDQTTGTFYELFAWYEWLIESRLAPFVSVAELAPIFMYLLEEADAFRPGLPRFLRRCATLKDDGLLDYVVIYTNQSEGNPSLSDRKGMLINVPRLLEKIYNRLASDDCLVDLLLTRPAEPMKTIPGKTFDRIFAALELPRPWSAANTLFFDDLPKSMIVANEVKHVRSAHVMVQPYTRSYDGSLVYKMFIETIRVARRHKAPADLEQRAYGLVHNHVLTMSNEALDLPPPPAVLRTWATYGRHLELFGNEDD
jgi:hypothetical protein